MGEPDEPGEEAPAVAEVHRRERGGQHGQVTPACAAGTTFSPVIHSQTVTMLAAIE